MKPKQAIFTPQAIKKVLPRILKPTLNKRGFSLGEILLDWHKIVGDTIATHCVPQKINFGRTKSHGAILSIQATSGATLWLQHSEYWLIEKINSYFGYKAIERLKIIHGLLPAPKIPDNSPPPSFPLKAEQEKMLRNLKESFSDEELVMALQNLGRSFYGTMNKTKE